MSGKSLKVPVGAAIELELDPAYLSVAGDRLVEIARADADDADRHYNALLTLLLFRQLEHTRQGTIKEILVQLEATTEDTEA